MRQVVHSTPQIARVNFFGRRELEELHSLLMPDEELMATISGYYAAGFAVLCVTSRRVLLIDKKLVRLNIEDVRLESIREVNYSQQAFFASLSLYFSGRALQFKTWHRSELRQASQIVQQKMFDMREKLHRKEEESVVRNEVVQEDAVNQRGLFPYTNTRRRKGVSVEQYVRERMQQWQRAEAYTNYMTLPIKAGRHILKLELSKR